jgi:hypothetical protein
MSKHPFYTLVLLSMLLYLGLATTAPPKQNYSFNVKFFANVTLSDLSPSIQNWELSSYYLSPCITYVILQPSNLHGGGRIFYANGTDEGFRFSETSIQSDSGTPPVTYGLNTQFPPATESLVRRPLELNCGRGHPRMSVRQSYPPELFFSAGPGMQFYACNADLPFGPAVEVFGWMSGDRAKPADCASINILPLCVDGEPDHEFGQKIRCYPNVSAITDQAIG